MSKSDHPFLHPGMQASIKMGRNIVGIFGVIHPVVREHCDIKVPALYAELDLALVKKLMSRASGVSVSDFPAIERDVTLMVPQREQAGRIVRLMKEGEPFSLVDVFIADDFSKSEEDFRRVTYRLKFQSAERTLKHEEVDTSMKNLLDLLASKHGVRMAEG